MFDLDRFKRAQENVSWGFAAALAEIRGGRKNGHWIWYVFPQLDGLGRSDVARQFALSGIEEAEAFLRDDLLRKRLLEISSAVADKLSGERPVPLAYMMGSRIDAMKIVSSMTLFGKVAYVLQTRKEIEDGEELFHLAEAILSAASAQGIGRCGFTEDRLRQAYVFGAGK